MNLDQTAPKREQSDLGSYCKRYRLPKNINRQQVVTRVNFNP